MRSAINLEVGDTVVDAKVEFEVEGNRSNDFCGDHRHPWGA